MKLFATGERILLTLWVGGMWAIGFMAVPALFNVLEDRQLAGRLAGEMFTIIYVVGLLCCAVLAVSLLLADGKRAFASWRSGVLAGALVLLVISFFVLQPMMQELKAQGLGEGGTQAVQFARLHGVSSALYLATSLAGLVLVIFGIHSPTGRTFDEGSAGR